MPRVLQVVSFCLILFFSQALGSATSGPRRSASPSPYSALKIQVDSVHLTLTVWNSVARVSSAPTSHSSLVHWVGGCGSAVTLHELVLRETVEGLTQWLPCQIL